MARTKTTPLERKNSRKAQQTSRLATIGRRYRLAHHRHAPLCYPKCRYCQHEVTSHYSKVKCNTCPGTFHKRCLNFSPEKYQNYQCEGCKFQIKPCYIKLVRCDADNLCMPVTSTPVRSPPPCAEGSISDIGDLYFDLSSTDSEDHSTSPPTTSTDSVATSSWPATPSRPAHGQPGTTSLYVDNVLYAVFNDKYTVYMENPLWTSPPASLGLPSSDESNMDDFLTSSDTSSEIVAYMNTTQDKDMNTSPPSPPMENLTRDMCPVCNLYGLGATGDCIVCTIREEKMNE